jgi:predicted nuclease of restriction endonuclease-like (RecB) superfamily
MSRVLRSAASSLDADYARLVGDLKQRIVSARTAASRSVNRELILLYWDIGKAIVERQARLGWGEAVVEAIARDLRDAFPGATGFSARNLRDMKRFFRTYTDEQEFWRQAVAKSGAGEPEDDPLPEPLATVPWGHHLLILNKVSEPEQRAFYLQGTTRFGWSRSVLLNQIKAAAFERSLSAGKAHIFPLTMPQHLAEQAEEALKSSYNLEFLGIGKSVKEAELEDRLIERLRDFILELGYGFCFIGRQYRLTLGRKDYFVDLLFYHRFLRALVAVELKIGSFEPAFAGQMDFYLNLLNDREKAAGDMLSIGVILCAEKDNLEVEFALKSKTNPIGVA